MPPHDTFRRLLLCYIAPRYTHFEDERSSLTFCANSGSGGVGVFSETLCLAFKPGTDDTPKYRAIPAIEDLQGRSTTVATYGPVTTEHMREGIPDAEYANPPKPLSTTPSPR